MNIWYQPMDWPLKDDWNCPVCENRSLTWGFIHSICRCDICHTEFAMREFEQESKPIVDVPIWRIKPEYADAARKAWRIFALPLDKLSDAQWEAAGAPQIT